MHMLGDSPPSSGATNARGGGCKFGGGETVSFGEKVIYLRLLQQSEQAKAGESLCYQLASARPDSASGYKYVQWRNKRGDSSNTTRWQLRGVWRRCPHKSLSNRPGTELKMVGLARRAEVSSDHLKYVLFAEGRGHYRWSCHNPALHLPVGSISSRPPWPARSAAAGAGR